MGAGVLCDGCFPDDGCLLPEPPDDEEDPPPDCDCEGAGDGEGDEEDDGSKLGRLGSLIGSDPDEPDDWEVDGEEDGSSFGTVPVTPDTTPPTPLTTPPTTEPTGFVDALAGVGASSETATVTTAVPVTNGTARATVDFHSPACLGDLA